MVAVPCMQWYSAATMLWHALELRSAACYSCSSFMSGDRFEATINSDLLRGNSGTVTGPIRVQTTSTWEVNRMTVKDAVAAQDMSDSMVASCVACLCIVFNMHSVS